MPAVNVTISPRMAELLQGGVIHITVDLFSSGKDIYARVVQPHPRLGLYPHASYSLDELEPLLEKVVVQSKQQGSPFGEDDSGSPYRTPTKRGQSVSVETKNDPVIGKVPVAITSGGVKNQLPRQSLTWKDLSHLSDDQLNRRILSIGKEIGADKAVSRISSARDLSSTSATTLYKWWQAASELQRFTLISVNKFTGKVEPKERDRLLARLSAGQYPFRGTDLQMEENEEEEEELSSQFQKGLVLTWSDDE